MPSVICQYHLDSLSDRQKIELSRQFNESGKNAMPHQIAVRLGITYSEALNILVKLEANRLCEMKLLIYHQCEPDIPISTMPYGQGFPQLPWLCPNCGEEVEDYKELSFDFMAIAFQPIQFT